MLENGDLKVLNLQNCSLTVQGRVRTIRDEDESCLEVQVHEALDPTIIPEVEGPPEKRTTLVKRGGRKA